MADEIKTIIAIEANFTKIQGQLGTLEGNFKSSFGRIEKIASGALGAFGVGLGVAGVATFAKSVVDLGDKLSDLSDATGLSVATLGGIRTVAERSGTSLDTFASGVLKAQVNLGKMDEDGKGAALAIKALGLNITAMQNASPEQFLQSFITALSKVTNANERAAIAAGLFGKAAVEVLPAILALAETGIPTLSNAAAEAYKRLGDLKDNSVLLQNSLQDLFAIAFLGFDRLFNITPAQKFQTELKKVAEEVQALNQAIAQNQTKPGFAFGIFSSDAEREKRRKLEGDQLAASRDIASDRFTELLDKQIRANQPKEQGKFTGALASSDNADKLTNALESYRQSLIKTITAQEVQAVKLRLGEEAALEAAQAYETLAFRAKLAADNLPIPPEVEESARRASAALAAMKADTVTLGEKSLIKLQEGALQAADGINILNESLAEGIKRRQAFADAANEGVGQTTTSKDEHERNLQKIQQELRAAEQLRDLRRQLALETLPPEQREQAQRGFDLEERLEQIEKWRIDTINATQDIAQANADAAALAAQAWDAFYNKQKENADDASEFMRRAFERGFDAVSDGLKDIADNGFKNIGDLGEKIRKTLNSLAADFVTLQLKKAVLGEDFGKPGAPIGGLLGGLFGGTKTTPTPVGFGQRPPGVEGPSLPTGFFSNPAGMQKSATDQAAIVAIQTQASTGQAAINATQTSAVTGIQGAVTTGQTSINATQQTAVSGIEAVKTVAIAAINAAKNIPGTPGQPLTAVTSAGGAPDTHDAFMSDATALADSLQADLDHAIQTGGSLLSRRNQESALATVPPSIATVALQSPFAQPAPCCAPPAPIGSAKQFGADPSFVGADMPELLVKVADEGISSIQNAGDTARQGIATTGALTKTGIDSLLGVALNALSAMIPGGAGGAAANLLGGGLSSSLSGGILGNWMGMGGGAAVGYGSAPAGMFGPSMANGGFFSSALGGLTSFFGFHEGGPLSKRGEGASFEKALSTKADLKPNENLFIGEDGEFVLNKRATAKIGKPTLEKWNRLETAPPNVSGFAPQMLQTFHDGGAIGIASGSITAGGPTMGNMPAIAKTATPPGRGSLTVNINSPDVDGFRRSESQIYANIARLVRAGEKYN